MKLYLQAGGGFDWENLLNKVSDYYDVLRDLLSVIQRSVTSMDGEKHRAAYMKTIKSLLESIENGCGELSELADIAERILTDRGQTDGAIMEAGKPCSRTTLKRKQLRAAILACRQAIQSRNFRS